MEDEYGMETQELSEVARSGEENESSVDGTKDFGETGGYEEAYDDDDGGNNFRGGNRGRGNFRARGRGPPPGWGGPPPMRFRGRGYGPGGPPMRGRGYFRGRGGPRFGPNNGPNFDNNWGPMGPPPPGMMGGPPPFGPPPGMMPPGGPMGPPPNMMGQPPFGGPPPGMPPNMPGPELWVETKSDEGKSYYYHARTRETTWTRPQEGPTVKVITQAEMEAMAAASGQMGNMGGQPMGMNGPPMGGVGGPPMGMMNGMGMMPPHGAPSLPPFMTQPPPWIKDSNNKEKQTDMESPNEADDMPPGESAPPLQANAPPNMMGFPGAGGPGGPGGPGGGGYPGGGAGGGAWGGWGGWPPPLVAQPPPSLAAANVPSAGAATQLQTTVTQPQLGQSGGNRTPDVSIVSETPAPVHKEETVIPPELEALAAEWSEHRAPDGRPYYYHAARQESVWHRPKPLKDLDELKAKIAAEKGEKLADKKDNKMEVDDSKIEVIDVDAHAEAQAAAEEEKRAEAERRKQLEAERQEKERLEREQKEKEDKLDKENKAKADRSRPISSTPISGTPWCVVWTGDGRVFFYNPTAHSSVWERPPQLIGRHDVDKAVSHPPDALIQLQRKEAAANAKSSNGDLKRAADSSSDDSDIEPAKKTKADDKKPATTAPTTGSTTGPSTGASLNSGKIDAGAEAAVEAEVRAARERALVPLDQRMRAFRTMLEDNDVSAFSTWEKELHKIVFDSRYLLLTSKERKQVFDKYMRERAEEERKEKKNRIQQKKTAFRQLMEEAKLHAKSSYTEFSSKNNRDDRFKAVEKARDREAYFTEYIAELHKREKDEKEKKREQAKTDFIALLKEKSVDRHSRWADAKKKIDSEARYKAVESSALREDYFREYCKMMKDERKKDKDSKEKDRDRSSKKEKRDKDRDKEKDKDREKEGKDKKKKEKTEEAAEPEAEASAEEETGDATESEAARQREARAQASIKEREREVQRALATSLRDRDKEREYHKRDEAVQHFNALLADLVRNPDLAWRDAKKQLKKDHRYSLAELLTKEDKERLFSVHTATLASKRRDKLRALLTELGVGCTDHWRDVRPKLKQEPTAPVYSSLTQMEREFRDYQRDKQSAAKTALRQLLLETRAITHRSLAAVKENAAALTALHDSLNTDARYLALDHIPEEREQIIMSYLEELAKKGPPPPPTATEPARRAKQ